MGVIRKEKIEGPAAWKGSELAGSDSWIYYLSDKTIVALEKALHHIKQKGLRAPNFTKEDFPIDKLSDEVSYFVNELENGRGFLLLRGLPIERYTDEEASIIYYGLGLHMGRPVTQNPKGDLLGNVVAAGDANDKNTRVYQTNSYLPYHTDLSDVVGLLSLRKAKAGGLSSLVSAVHLYNEILENYPEYLGILYRPVYFAHLGEELPSLSPIFSYYKGKLSCRYMRKYIELGQEIRGIQLSNVELEAFNIIDSLLHDERNRLDMMLEPGDIQFANNYTVLHSRTHFEDYDDPALKRHLLRLWLKMPNARELAPEFPGRNGIPTRETV
ncbi:Taurine catabolism dioxygenase TauD, TfdA family [Alteribacillus persepolensis]|uniref:Taurine catabolism dioxygenase TauD, TfdA family n=1 Tax=Alteribacillus persepolensis TaxID=568899 RepID=A0A1G8F8H5_9BACI|nr:TauD/TfdA family dioxygenase [Alteribacillus persepolensis]SDH78408.1 Taurine catabolism dioxygenase TauD, TfdA family [Alteribacillus persepolensis]